MIFPNQSAKIRLCGDSVVSGQSAESVFPLMRMMLKYQIVKSLLDVESTPPGIMSVQLIMKLRIN